MKEAIDRRRLKRAYSALYEDLSAALYDADIAGINYGSNPDEYDLEVGTILPRVFDANDTAAIERVVREEFPRWFGHLPNDSAKYEELAAEILRILELYRLNGRGAAR
jgi:hypothetical protein